MSGWSPDELLALGHDEIGIASVREDGSLRPFATIWAVRVGDELYVRSAYGPENGWYRRAKASGAGRVRAGGRERDVRFEATAPEVADAISAAYHAKYDHFGPAIVGTVVSAEAMGCTLRVVPA